MGRYQVHDGIKLTEEYPNGYGVSVICHDGSYGGRDNGTLWEVAVLHHDKLCYSTPITSDVIGWQTFGEVQQIMDAVQALKPEPTAGWCDHRPPHRPIWEEDE